MLSSEVLRARSRRSLWWLTGLGLLGVLAVSALIFAFTAPAGQADLDAAVQRAVAESEDWYQECLADPEVPDGQEDEWCSKPDRAQLTADAVWYLDPKPASHDDMVGLLSLAGGGAAVICLLVGATSGGADWGARTMGLLLSWEPRRLRVFFARMAVVVVLALLIQAVLIAVAWAAGSFIAARHGLDPGVALPADGSFQRPSASDSRELALRWIPLGVLAALGGYAVAMATRSTGWAIGATVAALVVLEPIVQMLWAWGSQWLVTTNVVAWLSGGTEWVTRRVPAGVMERGGTIYITDTRALLTMIGLVAVVTLGAAVLLRRRDVD